METQFKFNDVHYHMLSKAAMSLDVQEFEQGKSLEDLKMCLDWNDKDQRFICVEKTWFVFSYYTEKVRSQLYMLHSDLKNRFCHLRNTTEIPKNLTNDLVKVVIRLNRVVTNFAKVVGKFNADPLQDPLKFHGQGLCKTIQDIVSTLSTALLSQHEVTLYVEVFLRIPYSLYAKLAHPQGDAIDSLKIFPAWGRVGLPVRSLNRTVECGRCG